MRSGPAGIHANDCLKVACGQLLSAIASNLPAARGVVFGRRWPVDRFEGFGEFVAARGAALSRTAYLLTGDHHAAADLLQAALVATAVHWRRVVQGGNPEAYVRRAMVNQRTSWWRRNRRVVGADRLPEPVTGDESEQTAQRISLARVMATLPARQRAVIVLRFYEDYSVEQTARAMGCSAGTVKSQTHLALARLRALIGDLAVDRTGVPQ
jgi:RNA polymerase sigma-70 factor (sigma-E family)